MCSWVDSKDCSWIDTGHQFLELLGVCVCVFLDWLAKCLHWSALSMCHRLGTVMALVQLGVCHWIDLVSSWYRMVSQLPHGHGKLVPRLAE